MRIRTFRIFAVTALIFCFHRSLSQAPSNVMNTPSPTATSFSVFNNIPVNHFSGLPDVDLGLLSLQEKDFDLNLSLRYHAGLVKYDNHPGWVGLGWNLNVGGVINRRINSMADEDLYFSADNDNVLYALGYYHSLQSYSTSLLDIHGNPFPSKPLNNSAWNSEGVIVDNILKGVDYAPDEFNFNFMGYSGSFFWERMEIGS